MKKRKELDALVSGKIGSGRLKKGSGSCSAHELLRHDNISDSSDMDDFSILQPRRRGRKKHGSRLCVTSVCLSICHFILVTTCCLVSGALIWLHIGLREDIDLLRAHLQKVEAGNRNTPEALHLTYAKLRLFDTNISTLFNQVKKNAANIDNITLEVKHLKEVTNDLKESIAAAPALQELPKKIQALSESVVSFGSKMVALESNLKELKDQQSSIQINAQNFSRELDSLKRLLNLVESIEKMNRTLNDIPAQLEAAVFISNDSHSLHSAVQLLENFIHHNLSVRLGHLETSPSDKNITQTIVDLINQNIFHSNLSEPLEQTHDVLVLLTVLLTKFEQIPKSYVLSNANATDVVKAMLQESFEEMISTRDQKLKILDTSLQNLTSCCRMSESVPPV